MLTMLKQRREHTIKKITAHLHELKRGLKVFHWVHLNAEELDPHDKTYDAFDYIRALFLLPELLQL